MSNPLLDMGIFFIYNILILKGAQMDNLIKKRNPIAKDLRTPKYRMRVILKKNGYKRNLKNQRQYEHSFN